MSHVAVVVWNEFQIKNHHWKEEYSNANTQEFKDLKELVEKAVRYELVLDLLYIYEFS